MKFILIPFSLMNLAFVSCQQKKFFINIQKLDEKEVRIYYGKNDKPPFRKDKDGNYFADFYSANHVSTSTEFEEIKNLKNVFCINESSQCLYDDYEWVKNGYTISTNSHFSSDTADVGPFDSFLIEKLAGSTKR